MMIKPPIAAKYICILLIMALMTGHGPAWGVSFDAYGDKLSPSVVSDDINPPRSKVLREDVARLALPNAIADGEPLVELAGNNIPLRATLSAEELGEIARLLNDAINMARGLYLEHRDEVPQELRERARMNESSLINLQENPSKVAYLFYSDIRGSEDYSLGFRHMRYYGLAVDFMRRLCLKYPGEKGRLRLAQYIYSLCFPRESDFKIADRSKLRALHNKVQSVIFGPEEVAALKGDLHEFINGRASGRIPGPKIMPAGKYSGLRMAEEFLKRIGSIPTRKEALDRFWAARPDYVDTLEEYRQRIYKLDREREVSGKPPPEGPEYPEDIIQGVKEMEKALREELSKCPVPMIKTLEEWGADVVCPHCREKINRGVLRLTKINENLEVNIYPASGDVSLYGDEIEIEILKLHCLGAHADRENISHLPESAWMDFPEPRRTPEPRRAPSLLPAQQSPETMAETVNLMAEITKDMPLRAEDFRHNLIKMLTEHPDRLFYLGIQDDMGGLQMAQLMPLYKVIDDIKEMKDNKGNPLFPNLISKRGSAKELTAEVKDLAEKGQLELNNAFIGASQASVKDKLYDAIIGKAWIAAIDDSVSGAYLPVFEAVTLNMMASRSVDLTVIKNLYDRISDKPVDPAALEDMIKNRLVPVPPKAAKFDAKQLRDLYELAHQLYTSA